MKKFLSMALILLMLCNMTLISFAEEKYPISGTIAETDINWSLTEDGVLTVTGTGKFPEDELSRWEYADNVVKIVISEGITDIGDNSFCGFVNLFELQLPDTLLTIGSGAFGCWSDAELTVNIPKNLNRIGPEDPSDPKADIAFNGVKIKSFNVNPENPVSDLDVETIAKIYKGEITNWSEVGGSDGPIVLIGREAASGTRDGFESITGTKDSCKYAQELTSTGDVIQTVSGNPNAIGYASLAAVKDTVKVLKVEGVSPSKATIQDKTYKIQRDFVLVTPKGKELSAAAQKFFDYATSKDADDLIEKAGAIPVIR
mgnify:CR=1 FL=1